MYSAAVRLGAALFLLSLLPTQVFAVGSGTQLNFSVCGEGSGSSINIATPLSDSVGDSPEVTLAGSVENATQIDVIMDDTYSHTEALNVTDTSFSIALQLTTGTHKITLVANDVCQIQSDSDTIVITYEKKVAPSPGVTVPTDIGTGEGGVRVYPEVGKPSNQPESVFTPIVNIGRDVGKQLIDNLDLQASQQESPGTVAARISLAVVGIAVMLFGPILALWQRVRGAVNPAVRRLVGIRVLMPTTPSHRLKLTIRAIGGVLFLLSLSI